MEVIHKWITAIPSYKFLSPSNLFQTFLLLMLQLFHFLLRLLFHLFLSFTSFVVLFHTPPATQFNHTPLPPPLPTNLFPAPAYTPPPAVPSAIPAVPNAATAASHLTFHLNHPRYLIPLFPTSFSGSCSSSYTIFEIRTSFTCLNFSLQ